MSFLSYLVWFGVIYLASTVIQALLGNSEAVSTAYSVGAGIAFMAAQIGDDVHIIRKGMEK